MNYYEITVTTTDYAEEIVSNLFWTLTDLGVSISSLTDVLKLNKNEIYYDYIDEALLKRKKGVSLVRGYFPIENFNENLKKLIIGLEAISSNFENVGSLEYSYKIIDSESWRDVWKQHYKPIKFGKITVCPEWINNSNSELTVKIDSNLAFGTGEHETTSFCILAIEKYINNNYSVLDVGTGSGILGISAAKLNAKKVVMTEIDINACAVAEKNTLLNNVNNICSVINTGNLLSVNGKFNIVVANVTAEVLTFLSSQIVEKAEANGIIILSGILSDRLNKLIAVYENLGVELIESETKGEWSKAVFKKVTE